MKTLNATLAAACLGLALSNIGYSESPNRTGDPAPPVDQEKAEYKDHIMMSKGKMVCMTDGKTTEMDKTITLEDGTTVKADGTVTMKDGKTMKMGHDDLIMMDGKMSKRTHLVFDDGKMMVVKDGKPSVMEKDMTLENGTKVSKDGTVTLKDGTTSKIDETDIILLDGTMEKVPTVSGGPRNTN